MQAAIDDFHRLIVEDTAAARAAAEQLDAAFLARGILFAGKAMPAHLRPHFFSREQRRQLETAAAGVLHA